MRGDGSIEKADLKQLIIRGDGSTSASRITPGISGQPNYRASEAEMDTLSVAPGSDALDTVDVRRVLLWPSHKTSGKLRNGIHDISSYCRDRTEPRAILCVSPTLDAHRGGSRHAKKNLFSRCRD